MSEHATEALHRIATAIEEMGDTTLLQDSLNAITDTNGLKGVSTELHYQLGHLSTATNEIAEAIHKHAAAMSDVAEAIREHTRAIGRRSSL